MTEGKKNRILNKIEQSKKALRREKAMFGDYHDGAGIRYGIAELYFQLNDYKKTNRYLNWFRKNFPDDVRYIFFELGEAVTKFELGKKKEAKFAIVSLIKKNTYLIDLILGLDIKNQNKHEWTESESLHWAKTHLADHQKLTTENFLTWLSEFRNEETFQNWYNKFISIQKQLVGLKVSKERSALLNAARECMKDWQNEIQGKK